MMKMEFLNNADALSLKIYDYIGDDGWGGGVTTSFIEDALKDGNNKPLNIYINSNGGEVFEGFAIYNILKRYEGYKTVIIDGLAASIASVIAMSGDKVCMNKASMMMIHNASGVCFGNAEDMKKVVNALEEMNGVIKDVYKTRCNLSDEELTEMMDNETFLNADDCVKYGFADEIIESNTNVEADKASYENLKTMIDSRIKQINLLKQNGFETQSQGGEDLVIEEEKVLNNKSHWGWLKNGGI